MSPRAALKLCDCFRRGRRRRGGRPESPQAPNLFLSAKDGRDSTVTFFLILSSRDSAQMKITISPLQQKNASFVVRSGPTSQSILLNNFEIPFRLGRG